MPFGIADKFSGPFLGYWPVFRPDSVVDGDFCIVLDQNECPQEWSV